jgi:hypothetical protein
LGHECGQTQGICEPVRRAHAGAARRRALPSPPDLVRPERCGESVHCVTALDRARTASLQRDRIWAHRPCDEARPALANRRSRPPAICRPSRAEQARYDCIPKWATSATSACPSINARSISKRSTMWIGYVTPYREDQEYATVYSRAKRPSSPSDTLRRDARTPVRARWEVPEFVGSQ